MRALTIISATAFAIGGVLAAPSLLPAGPSGVNITRMTMAGDDCGTISYVFDGTDVRKSTLTLSFSNYYAIVGGNYPEGQNKKECTISLGMDIPSCYKFAIPTVDYCGYYDLDRNVKGTQRTAYWFKSKINQAFALWTPIGPLEGKPRLFTLDFKDWGTVRSECCDTHTTLNIENSLRVDNSANNYGTGYFDVQKKNNFRIVLHFTWTLCCLFSDCPRPPPV
ncbi:hypothetical protein FRC18_000050 [Serendipita sp. 400]|nr:hypothetical protein FRC18_000050 [Serendipita sp. 400]